jgi:formylmethanofuran dehydrogenase subunit E
MNEMTDHHGSEYGEAFSCLKRLHTRLCPRQVLGVRIGSRAAGVLGIDLPQRDKRIVAFMETDGCAADGVAVATGCHVGRRTMRIVDYGKVAATFVDTCDGNAIRVSPKPGIRKAAQQYAPEARTRWQAQLLGYQRMPDEEIIQVQHVILTLDLEALISRPGLRTECQTCGEEIMNGREIRHEGIVLCQACYGGGYYRQVRTSVSIPAATSV